MLLQLTQRTMLTLPKILKIPILLFVVFNEAPHITGQIIEDRRFFRYDYTYDETVQGWLKFHPIPATWYEARLRCQLEGAVLASPLNEIFLAAIKKIISHDIFIGIHSTISKGDYYSIEGVPLAKIPLKWAPGEPDNCDNSEECLVLKGDGTIEDVRCNEVYPFTCYRNAKNTKFNDDCGTVDDEYTLSVETGHCYKFHHIGRTWQRAFMTCSSEGGHLAIINSAAEAIIVNNLFANYTQKDIWAFAFIGFHYWREQGMWNTIHGDTLTDAGYSRWDTDQPDKVGEYCGAIFRNALLHDFWCNVTTPFICEKDPRSLSNDFYKNKYDI